MPPRHPAVHEYTSPAINQLLSTAAKRLVKNSSSLILPTLMTVASLTLWAILIGLTHPQSRLLVVAIPYWLLFAPLSLGLVCGPFWALLCISSKRLVAGSSPCSDNSAEDNEKNNQEDNHDLAILTLKTIWRDAAITGMKVATATACGLAAVVLPGLFWHYRTHLAFWCIDDGGDKKPIALPLTDKRAFSIWVICTIANVLGTATLVGLVVSLPFSTLLTALWLQERNESAEFSIDDDDGSAACA